MDDYYRKKKKRADGTLVSGLSLAVGFWLLIGGAAYSPWIGDIGDPTHDIVFLNIFLTMIFVITEIMVLIIVSMEMSFGRPGTASPYIAAAMAGFTLTTLCLFFGPAWDDGPKFTFWSNAGIYTGMAAEFLTGFFAGIVKRLDTAPPGALREAALDRSL